MQPDGTHRKSGRPSHVGGGELLGPDDARLWRVRLRTSRLWSVRLRTSDSCEYGYGRPGDALMMLSTSGNSGNVVRAAQVACAMGLHTIALTGQSGGKLKSITPSSVAAPDGSVRFSA